ncbi:MAG: acyl-ACP--UDP-N-acetylglucosamine O-acyltransferase [Parvibaculaceae bacterium]|nr:acyl-ACP--UDP-N-acetylglucosamine O-acyltransferase [Parvibaculaceae bacterium]
MSIHPSAVIDPQARIGQGAHIGPFCVVGPDVTLGEDVVLHSHVVVTGRTSIGPRTQVYPFASLGHPPQDLKFSGEPSTLEIGSDNIIRENVTMNPGTKGGGMKTVVGSHCAFLATSHVGHDCIVGDHVVFSNAVLLAGHCQVGDYAILGGAAAVHQFARIGAYAFVGGMSGVENDVIPYGLVIGNRAHLAGLNLVGMKRRGFGREQIATMRAAYERLFTGEGTFRERVEAAAHEFAGVDEVMQVIDFIRSDKDRALCMPRQERAA